MKKGIVNCLLLTSLILGGCINLKPRTDDVKQYSLGRVNAVYPNLTGAPAIHIERPSLPGYLDSNRLQYRKGDGEVCSISMARWAEPLSEGVARALGESIQLQGNIATAYPWPQLKGSHKLKVQFHQFSGSADGRIQVHATWQLTSTAGQFSVDSVFNASQLAWEPGDAVSLIEGLNAALLELSADISEKLPLYAK